MKFVAAVCIFSNLYFCKLSYHRIRLSPGFNEQTNKQTAFFLHTYLAAS